MGEEETRRLLDQMIEPELSERDENPFLANPQEKYYQAPRESDRRRVATQDRRRFEVNKMWELHHEIVRRIVIGQKNADIARSLGVSEVMISYTRNSKVCQKRIESMREERDKGTIDIAKEIRDFAIEPLEFLRDIIRDKGETSSKSLAAKTSENWLDRAGYGAPKKLEAVVAYLTKEEIDQIKQDAKADAMNSGTIIEAQAEVIKNQEEIIETQKKD